MTRSNWEEMCVMGSDAASHSDTAHDIQLNFVGVEALFVFQKENTTHTRKKREQMLSDRDVVRVQGGGGGNGPVWF